MIVWVEVFPNQPRSQGEKREVPGNEVVPEKDHCPQTDVSISGKVVAMSSVHDFFLVINLSSLLTELCYSKLGSKDSGQ